MNEPVAVKGNGNILEFWFDREKPYEELKDALIARLDVNASFYIGSRRPVVFYGKKLTDIQKNELRGLMRKKYCFDNVGFEDEGEAPFAVPARPPAPAKIRERLVRAPKAAFEPTPKRAAEPEQAAEPESPAVSERRAPREAEAVPSHLFISQTVRSGQRIAATGDVTVIGDVNSGAEVIAGGSIAVFGRTSGMLHAGAYGDSNAVIAASRLVSGQIRLCGKIAVLPAGHKPDRPEIVRLIDGKITISSIN